MIATNKIRHKLGAAKRIIKRRMALRRTLSTVPKQGGKVVILATPTHGNLGDQAIVLAEKQMLRGVYGENIYEIPNEQYLSFPTLVERVISPEDLVVIDGGGNLGTIWDYEDDKITDIIERFHENRIVVFPQTCFYDDALTAKKKIEHNRRVYAKAARLSVMLRDEESYSSFSEFFPETKAYFVPDIVLSLVPKTGVVERNGALTCFRSDREKAAGSEALKNRAQTVLHSLGMNQKEISTIVNCEVGVQNREQEVNKKLVEFASAEIVITDRLHAMLFCAITGTPCVALDNISRKVSGSYRWIKDLPYIALVTDIAKIEDAVSKVLGEKDTARRFVYPQKRVLSIIKEEQV